MIPACGVELTIEMTTKLGDHINSIKGVMMLKTSWLLVVVLAIGCSSLEHEAGESWVVNEQPAAVNTDPSGIAEPPDVTVLRASPDDPHYGVHSDFYRDFPRDRDLRQCAALIIIFDLQFQEDVLLLLPAAVTQTSERYALEIPRWAGDSSWLLASTSGDVWAHFAYDFEGPDNVQLHSFPFSAPVRFTDVPPNDGTGPLQVPIYFCGPAPEGLVESIIRPPEVIEIEIWSNGEPTFLQMKADVQNRDWGLTYTYQAID
jgi:hypothetical protein